jgi:uncharacterized protein
MRKPLIEHVLYYGHESLHCPHMQMDREFMQHGTTNCYEQSICVAYMALRIAQKLRVRVDVRSLVRGCLLHDYFLYDWHDKDAAIRFHTFRHPKLSLKNAEKEFSLNKIEKDIILEHMFPLCAKLPKYRESFIITLADKCCAASEIWHLYSLKKIIRAMERGLLHELEQKAC